MKYLFKPENQADYEEFVSNIEEDTPYVVSTPAGVEYYYFAPIRSVDVK